MVSLLSPRRTDPQLALRSTVPDEGRPEEPSARPPGHPLGWPMLAGVGGLVAALTGWILTTGLTVVGWLGADAGSLGGAVRLGTQLWLLTNGAGARIGSTTVTVMPWGLTALVAFMVFSFAGYAARQARNGPGKAGALVGGITALTTLAYVVPVAVVGFFVGQPSQALRGFGVAAAVMGVSAALGSARALGYEPTMRWPAWCRAIPRAVLGANLVLLVAGAAALATALLRNLDRVLQLTDALRPGVAGGIALTFAQLAFAPNAIVWSASYALGAGLSLGHGSVVSPAATNLGMLPAIPMFGAVPAEGPGGSGQLWWLAAGVLAGAVAAWLVMRARPAARVDEMCLVGGLSGLLAGATFVLLAWASSGDLGVARLSGLGPRLLPLLVMSATLTGLAGLAVGLLLGLRRWWRHRSPS